MIGTIVVSAIVLVIVGAVVWSIVKNHRQGKNTCGGDCSRCRGCH